MTKSNSTSTLMELKLAVINYHDGDNMDYLQKNISRDACYTSYNSLTYKKKMLADAVTDFESYVAEGKDIAAERACEKAERIELELEQLTERHVADLGVYLVINDGEEWSITVKPKSKASLASKLAAMQKRVA
jgi:hypothetical protein